jgi:hypothetical protein
MRPSTPFWSRLAAGLLVLLLASCASHERPHRGASPKPPQPIAGDAMYFGGALVASIHVGMEFQRPEGGEPGARGDRDGGGRRGGGMSFGGGAGPMHFGGEGGGRGGHGERGERGDGPRGEGDGGAHIRPSNGLPLMIHLKLTNSGSAPIEVAVRDFVSPLGNFVVQPATLTVSPGESAEFAPMTSFVQGDLPEEMPATLVLRTTAKTEKQVIVLRPLPPRDAPAPAAPPQK